ncbi:KTSC domain-containing protein [Tardiphaga sp. 619_E2_N8_5]|jgi:hypothetical protein|uniref:KTSC domain-containing protein n=1 Tax=unclassified Tardiphaga TaxID=2631404 RepID=UPI003F202AC5
MPSTAIRHVTYDPVSREMRVTFTSGRRYAYAQVPPEVHAAFSSAASRGAFFNHRIRDRFAYRELPRSGSERRSGADRQRRLRI